MNDLIKVINQSIPEIINDFNTVRLPALETAWGRTVAEQREFWDHDQISVEYSKNFSIPINNAFFRAINSKLPQFKEKTTRGSDYIYGDVLIEDKNAFNGTGKQWTGNGFGKCPWHLLKRFEIDEISGRIVKAFVMLVDLSVTEANWGEKTVNGKTSQRVGLQFTKQDRDNLLVAWGNVIEKRKWLEFQVNECK